MRIPSWRVRRLNSKIFACSQRNTSFLKNWKWKMESRRFIFLAARSHTGHTILPILRISRNLPTRAAFAKCGERSIGRSGRQNRGIMPRSETRIYFGNASVGVPKSRKPGRGSASSHPYRHSPTCWRGIGGMRAGTPSAGLVAHDAAHNANPLFKEWENSLHVQSPCARVREAQGRTFIKLTEIMHITVCGV